jgi:hypothetical protein
MITFQLNTPVNVGTLTAPVNVARLRVTGVAFSTTPALAPLGTAELLVTLTDTDSPWQEVIRYADSSVLDFFATLAPVPPPGATYEDIMSVAVLQKLIADGRLPVGTLVVS